MNVSIPRSMLEWFVAYVDQNNTMVANSHTNQRTREIEPASVRREVNAANAWLERARRALKQTGEPLDQDIARAFDDAGDVSLTILEHNCKVRVTLGKPCSWFALEAERAANFASAVIKHARIAGRKTGRIVEVKI